MNWFNHSDKAELLLLSWAYHHPYLYTFIEVSSPTLVIVLVVAGFNMVNGVMRGKSRWQRR